MLTSEHEIEVRAPVRAVFERWARFEGWPEFIEDLDEVRRVDDTHLRVRGQVGGERREWSLAVTELSTDVSVAWTGVDGPPGSAIATLEELTPTLTRVTLRLDDEARTDEDAGGPTRARRILERLRQVVEGGGAHAAPAPGTVPAARVLTSLRDLAVHDPDGEPVGDVSDVYLDLEAMAVSHLAVTTGALGGAHLVPAEMVSWDPVWRALTVPVRREQLRDAPPAPPDGELTPQDQAAVTDFYGRIGDWEARHDAIARRQGPPPPTPQIAEAEGRPPGGIPAPTPQIAEAELLGDADDRRGGPAR